MQCIGVTSGPLQECSHNKKQTHYHCIQSEGCDKVEPPLLLFLTLIFKFQVYISTSDVQMHFNYHRKDNAIQREGFLRFRGAEDCHTTHCLYRGINLTDHTLSHLSISQFWFPACLSSSSPLPVTRSHHRASNDNCKDHYYPSTARPLNNSLLTACNPL